MMPQGFPAAGAALFSLVGFLDRYDVFWEVGSEVEANPLLARHHYLGPIGSGGSELVVIGSTGGVIVAAQVWRRPTARNLPADGTWLELSRWCLTAAAGDNAGSIATPFASSATDSPRSRPSSHTPTRLGATRARSTERATGTGRQHGTDCALRPAATDRGMG